MGLPDRRRLYELLEVGQSGDRISRFFDVALITLIVANVSANIVESIPAVRLRYHTFFDVFELFSVAIFTAEYVLRAACCVENPRFRHPVKGRLRYLLTGAALTDLLAIAPFFLSGLFDLDLRMLRVLRLLRIFKLAHYFSALSVLMDVIRAEKHAFGAAYFVVALGLLVASSGIFVFEHAAQPEAFGSIPGALWWSIVTMTTVGYGDATPITLGGKVFAAIVILIGIGTVAVPTGILATGFALELQRRRDIYASQVQAALADGFISDAERLHLDEARRSLGLSKEATDRVEERPTVSALRREAPAPQAALPLVTCPHCGEYFASPVEKKNRNPFPPSENA